MTYINRTLLAFTLVSLLSSAAVAQVTLEKWNYDLVLRGATTPDGAQLWTPKTVTLSPTLNVTSSGKISKLVITRKVSSTRARVPGKSITVTSPSDGQLDLASQFKIRYPAPPKQNRGWGVPAGRENINPHGYDGKLWHEGSDQHQAKVAWLADLATAEETTGVTYVIKVYDKSGKVLQNLEIPPYQGGL